MKRYLVFGFDGFYPVGGWSDFKAAYDLLDVAKGAAHSFVLIEAVEYAQVVDLESLTLLFTYYKQDGEVKEEYELHG